MTRTEQIYKNVLNAMLDAEEIEGVEDPFEYLKLMRRIRTEAQKRANACADNIDWERKKE
jgi:hypothetical protein